MKTLRQSMGAREVVYLWVRDQVAYATGIGVCVCSQPRAKMSRRVLLSKGFIRSPDIPAATKST